MIINWIFAKIADDYQNINRLSTHNNLMIIIRRSAKTADDYQKINGLSAHNHQMIIHILKISKNSTRLPEHLQIIST